MRVKRREMGTIGACRPQGNVAFLQSGVVLGFSLEWLTQDYRSN